MNLNKTFELTTRYDARKSFYGKALVEEDGDTLTLYSYLTPVAKIVNGQYVSLGYEGYSQTTNRHIKEFRRQFERSQSSFLFAHMFFTRQ